MALPIVKNTIKEMLTIHLTSFEKLESFKIVDIGCGSGPNTLLFMSEIIDTFYNLSNQNNNQSPEISILLNDLYKNDFNNIFNALPLFYEQLKEKYGHEFSQRCFISVVASSFYERVLPSKSLHFVHSSSSLHWLSQVPENLDNKGHIYMAKDWKMILTLLGRSIPEPSSNDGCCLWELLAQSLLDMVSQGLVKKEDVDSFNLPFYTPYYDEVKEIVMKENSFDLDKIEVYMCNWDPNDDEDDYNNIFDKKKSGENIAKRIRAVSESMLVTHFGELPLDMVFKIFAERVANHLEMEKTKYTNLTICLKKK
ncbi:probable jasmonic acid carboxyl methyltransferase 1 [Impatiens glandulifera]|uniref:probable jasmonic acid carboxyl methyltransferase 1 n=1 Tax=Impatiens glandulifera TaxID=253017 RepID=UPI001FB1107A|nr:probable jasmonic acid carboxyl methyltransferase 1 [Impatiens glandulifera]